MADVWVEVEAWVWVESSFASLVLALASPVHRLD